MPNARDMQVVRVDNYTVAGPRTDAMAGPASNDSIGGYCRNKPNANNFRYFADLYLDHTLQHVSLGNASTIGACTVMECQVPTVWSDGAITVTVNRGAIADEANAWVYVYDTTGTSNTNGFLASSGVPVVTRRGVVSVLSRRYMTL